MAFTTINLRADAIAEACRLTRARALIRDGDRDALDRLESDATWIAKSGRRRLCRTLGCRICLIWRATFEDESGQALESHLVPLLIQMRDVTCPPCIAYVEDAVRARVEHEADRWRADVESMHAAFSAARLARATAIATAAASSPVPLQPGLFDRRTEREDKERAAATAVDEEAFTKRRNHIAASRPVAVPARLLLVLVP